MRRDTLLLSVACCLAALLTHAPVQAWIYPEHRQIGVAAWRKLSPEARAFYEALWRRVRDSTAAGLCASAVPGEDPKPGASGERSPCIDYAAWPAIAGDHSCSPHDLLQDVLPSRFVHAVARVSEQVSRDLAGADSKQDRENIWITSNLRLQDVDDAYVTRAGANNAHFLLPMHGKSVVEFLDHSTKQGAPLNAMGLYVQYHAAALRLAAAIGPDADNASRALARQVLALEAYALHFLQDMFASGHVAGTWGDVAVRKGTHDYYCAHGYATTTWAGKPIVMFGDAHIRSADLARSAASIAASMEQVARHARQAQPGQAPDPEAMAVADLDSCQRMKQPATLPMSVAERRAVEALLSHTPRPGHGPDSVAWPRYRADFGKFIGLHSGIALGGALGGYGGRIGRPFNEFVAAARLGYGLEGVVASMNTGTMYLQVGLVRQGEQTDFCEPGECVLQIGSAALPRVPSRPGVTVGLRLPFWLIPGDLIVLGPILALASPSDLTRVAIRAASGGLIPWQRSFATRAGHLEFVIGRAVNATFFGLSGRVRTFAEYSVPDRDGNLLGETGFRSIMLHFPVFEYTPFRTFAQQLSASFQLQLGYAIDIPFDTVRYTDRSLPGPDWDPAHIVMLRVNVNLRSYL